MKNITTTLKKLIAEHGMVILEQEQRLKAILADLHPHEKRFRYLLELSFRAEIPRKLIALQNESISIWEAQVGSMKHYFKEEYFLEDGAIKSVFDCWVELLKKEENTVIDIDGNVYHIIKIGKQEWLVENLKTTRYRNGDLIGTTVPATKDISTEAEPKYHWAYDGDEENVIKYGRLYTYYTTIDKRNIAPKGWRVSTHTDWYELMEYLRVKFFRDRIFNWVFAECLTDGKVWKERIFCARNNNSGFSAIPGGYRSIRGEFEEIGYSCCWWTPFEYMDRIIEGVIWVLTSQGNLVDSDGVANEGYSVRCIKDC